MFQESLGELISVEQDGDDCIRPNADLEMKPQIRSKEQLKCMYSECLDETGKFKDLNTSLWSRAKQAKNTKTPHK